MQKRNIKFHLKRHDGNQATSIFAKAQVSKKTFKFYIGKSIHPQYWNSNQGEPITDRSLINKYKKAEPQIHTILDNIKSRMNTVSDAIISYVNLKEQGGSTISHDTSFYFGSSTNFKSRIPKPPLGKRTFIRTSQ